MNLLLRLLLLLGLIVAPGCHLAFGSLPLDHLEERSHDWALDGVSELHIVSGAGSVEVTGGARDGVHLEGVAKASSQEALDAYRIVTTRVGDTLRIEPQLEREFERVNVAYDMRVELPAHLALRVSDGSGSIVVRDVASLVVEDGSGSIVMERVAGAVSIADGSGSIAGSELGGAVSITDGSGSIQLDGVGGLITLTDGSGSVTIRAARGGVHVLADGSGSLDISDVSGDVRIDADGSGGVSITDVRGDVHLGPLGSGSLHHGEVSGSVYLIK